MIKVLQISIDVDLSLFSRYLWQLGVRHRIFEESGQQQLRVDSREEADRVLELYEQFRSGRLRLEEQPNPHHDTGPSTLTILLLYIKSYPGILVFVLLCLLCYPLTLGLDHGDVNGWLHLFTFTDFIINGEHILFAPFGYAMSNGQIWRLWTPMLLHFGVMHLVFNLLWLWEVGRRIEIMQGSGRVFNLVMITGLFANVAQYQLTQNVLFGGMSGVVYGLLGYALIWSRMRPERSLGLPAGIYIFMLVWLLLGFSGVIDSFGFGTVANGAHLGGLLSGVVLGFMAAVVAGKNENNQERE